LHDEEVIIDINHRRAGQALELEVELIAILQSAAGMQLPSAEQVNRQSTAGPFSGRKPPQD